MDITKTPLGTMAALTDLSPITLSHLLIDCGEYVKRFTKATYIGPNVAQSGLLYLATEDNGFEWEIIVDIHNNQIMAHIYS